MPWAEPLKRGTPVFCQSTSHRRVDGIVLGHKVIITKGQAEADGTTGLIYSHDYVVADRSTLEVLQVSSNWVFPEPDFIT